MTSSIELIFFLPATESLTAPLTGDWKFWLKLLFSYRHSYHPSFLKSTLGMLKVAELWFDLWFFVNEPEVLFSMNVPPRAWVEIEHVMSTFWPQATSPAGLMEILAFGKLTEKNVQYCSVRCVALAWTTLILTSYHFGSPRLKFRKLFFFLTSNREPDRVT